MDLFIYLAVLLVTGCISVKRTSSVSEDIGIVTMDTVPVSDLPVASNLACIREQGAYTAILKQFNLI